MTQRTLGGLFDTQVARPNPFAARIEQVRHLLPPVEWALPRLADLPSWANAKRVCVDIESRDPEINEMGPGFRRGTADVVGVAFAIEDGPSFYLPMRHEVGENLDRAQVVAYLRDQAAVFRGDLVGSQLDYDLDGLDHEGVRFAPRRHLDVLVAAPVIDGTHHRYNLDAVLEREGLPGKDETVLREVAAICGWKPSEVKSNLHRLPAKYVAGYGLGDVRKPLELLRRQERQMEAMDMLEAWDLESRVLPACRAMRTRGQRVNLALVRAISAWCLAQGVAAMAEVSRLGGRTVTLDDLQKAAALGLLIEDATGVKLPKTPTGKYQITTKTLKRIKHPITAVLRRAREVDKIRTQFCGDLLRFAIKDANGDDRVHCTFNQVRIARGDEGDDSEKGTRTYRLSSTNFNKQNQPTRSEMLVDLPGLPVLPLGVLWRSVFLADRETMLASLDFSQQEPRIECHLALKLNLPGARAMADIWRRNPHADSHQAVADMTGLPRKDAKVMRLAIGYGAGGKKVCEEFLDKPTKTIVATYGKKKGEEIVVACDEVQTMIDAFNRGAPYIKELSKAAIRRAEKVGYVRLVDGHRITPPPGEEYKVGNYIIQGNAAVQTKRSIAAMHEAGIPIQDQIHDEVNFSTAHLEQMHAARRIMERAMDLDVPVVVAVEAGDNWGQIDDFAWVEPRQIA